MGIDPRKDHKEKGIFIMPMSGMSLENQCISKFFIAHTRDKEGYKTTWYDAIDAPDSQVEFYNVNIPKADGPLYFIVETYTRDFVPIECTEGKANNFNGFALVTHPMAYIEV